MDGRWFERTAPDDTHGKREEVVSVIASPVLPAPCCCFGVRKVYRSCFFLCVFFVVVVVLSSEYGEARTTGFYYGLGFWWLSKEIDGLWPDGFMLYVCFLATR